MMRRVIAGLVAIVAVSAATLIAQQSEPASPPQAATASGDENWKPTEIKNLTVLPKDMSVDDVMKIMKTWNTVLNVDCVFCHVGQVGKPLSTFDFASDDKKRKEASRTMLRAVMDTNAKFKAISDDDPPQISCATCHKRSRHVEDTLPAEPPKEH